MQACPMLIPLTVAPLCRTAEAGARCLSPLLLYCHFDSQLGTDDHNGELTLQASKERLEDVRRELREIEEALKPQELRYQAEHNTLEELRALQRKRDELKVKLAEAENRLDLAMVADIKCAPLPVNTMPLTILVCC